METHATAAMAFSRGALLLLANGIARTAGQPCASTTGRTHVDVSLVLGVTVATFNTQHRSTFLNGLAGAANAQLSASYQVTTSDLSFSRVRPIGFQFSDDESTAVNIDFDANSEAHAREIVAAMTQYSAAVLGQSLGIYVQDIRTPLARMTLTSPADVACYSLWSHRADIRNAVSLRIGLASSTITQLPAASSTGYDGFRQRLATRVFMLLDDVRIEEVRVAPLTSGANRATIFAEIAATTDVQAARLVDILMRLDNSAMTTVLGISGESVVEIFHPIVRQLFHGPIAPPPAPSSGWMPPPPPPTLPPGLCAPMANGMCECAAPPPPKTLMESCGIEFGIIIFLAVIWLCTAAMWIHTIRRERMGTPLFVTAVTSSVSPTGTELGGRIVSRKGGN